MQESYLAELDDYFCERYCNYTKITAIEGYHMPDLIAIQKDGNVQRKSSDLMKLNRQSAKDELLKKFKNGLADTDFSFSFAPVGLFTRFKNFFTKDAFYKTLPALLAHSGETPQSVGEKLAIDDRVWQGILKGSLAPEKNTLIAIAIVCRMTVEDASSLFFACDTSFSDENVRDVVVSYVLTQKIFNSTMLARCFQEYKIESIPLKWEFI